MGEPSLSCSRSDLRHLVGRQWGLFEGKTMVVKVKVKGESSDYDVEGGG